MVVRDIIETYDPNTEENGKIETGVYTEVHCILQSMETTLILEILERLPQRVHVA